MKRKYPNLGVEKISFKKQISLYTGASIIAPSSTTKAAAANQSSEVPAPFSAGSKSALHGDERKPKPPN